MAIEEGFYVRTKFCKISNVLYISNQENGAIMTQSYGGFTPCFDSDLFEKVKNPRNLIKILQEKGLVRDAQFIKEKLEELANPEKNKPKEHIKYFFDYPPCGIGREYDSTCLDYPYGRRNF